MTVGKGVFRFDDHLNFGKIVDELSNFCYSITYIPKRDCIVVCCHRSHADKLKKYNLLKPVKIHGGLAFAVIMWR